jgi:hypothetical protein
MPGHHSRAMRFRSLTISVLAPQSRGLPCGVSTCLGKVRLDNRQVAGTRNQPVRPNVQGVWSFVVALP